MKREILCTPKKDKGQFSCVFLQKPGLVRPPPSSPPLPSIFQKIGFKICQINVTLNFSCPSLSEAVTYRWIYNELPVFLIPDRRRFVSQRTGNLYIAKVEAQDAGNYSCYVSSPITGKSVFSKFIPLIPLPPDEGRCCVLCRDVR